MRTPYGHNDHADELARLRAAIAAAGDVVYEWNLADDGMAWLGDPGHIFAPPHKGPPRPATRWRPVSTPTTSVAGRRL